MMVWIRFRHQIPPSKSYTYLRYSPFNLNKNQQLHDSGKIPFQTFQVGGRWQRKPGNHGKSGGTPKPMALISMLFMCLPSWTFLWVFGRDHGGGVDTQQLTLVSG